MNSLCLFSLGYNHKARKILGSPAVIPIYEFWLGSAGWCPSQWGTRNEFIEVGQSSISILSVTNWKIIIYIAKFFLEQNSNYWTDNSYTFFWIGGIRSTRFYNSVEHLWSLEFRRCEANFCTGRTEQLAATLADRTGRKDKTGENIFPRITGVLKCSFHISMSVSFLMKDSKANKRRCEISAF